MWPVYGEMSFDENILSEKRTNSIADLSTTVNVQVEPLLKLENLSKLDTVYKITAWIMRFINNCNKGNTNLSGPLTATEI